MIDGGLVGLPLLASSLGGEAAAGAGAAAGASWLPWLGGAAAGAGLGAGAASLMSGGKGTGTAPSVNIPAPPGLIPAQQPNAKPQRKSQQQSFLSGAAMAQSSATPGSGTGKSLLGA